MSFTIVLSDYRLKFRAILKRIEYFYARQDALAEKEALEATLKQQYRAKEIACDNIRQLEYELTLCKQKLRRDANELDATR